MVIVWQSFGQARSEQSPKPINKHARGEARFRKILVSVKFLSAILGPEIGAPVLWTPGKKCVLSAGKPMSIKFLVLGGGGILGFWGGGGSADFIFMGARIFLRGGRERASRAC